MNRALRSLVLLQLIFNAVLLWLGYYWLGLSESNGPRLIWSATVIIVFVCATLWLHGTSFAHFRRPQQHVLDSAKITLRHLVPLVVLALIALALYGLVTWAETFIPHRAFVIASYLTLKLRRPVKPVNVVQVLNACVWLTRWVILPVFFLPLAAQIATLGWSGFKPSVFRIVRRWPYWVQVCFLLLAAIWVPFKLFAWVPEVQSFNLQLLSFVLRMAGGYLLFVFALLALAFVTSMGRPRLSQDTTVPSP
jgi:hypothetical protein